jgi:hypothetical protein
MSIDRTVRRLSALAVVWMALVAAGCANLAAVRDFAATSSDAAQYSQLVSAYVESPARQKRYEPGAAARSAKLANQKEAAAFASVSKLLVTAATDHWRQRKLVNLIEDANGPFQVVVNSLVTIVETGFATDVSIERAALDKYYGTLAREGKDPAGLARAGRVA